MLDASHCYDFTSSLLSLIRLEELRWISRPRAESHAVTSELAAFSSSPRSFGETSSQMAANRDIFRELIYGRFPLDVANYRRIYDNF